MRYGIFISEYDSSSYMDLDLEDFGVPLPFNMYRKEDGHLDLKWANITILTIF